MARTWVLDTETKGTGANMVPIERRRAGTARERELALVELGAPAAAPGVQPQRRQAARFKLVDVRSSRVLAEDVGAREAIRALEDVGSVVDVRIYRWAPEPARWRLLSLEESKALWAFRGRAQPGPEAP